MLALVFAVNRYPAVKASGAKILEHQWPGHHSATQGDDSALPTRFAQSWIIDLLPRQIFHRYQRNSIGKQIQAHPPAFAAALDEHVPGIDVCSDSFWAAILNQP